jgi:hypothetical protein
VQQAHRRFRPSPSRELTPSRRQHAFRAFDERQQPPASRSVRSHIESRHSWIVTSRMAMDSADKRAAGQERSLASGAARLTTCGLASREFVGLQHFGGRRPSGFTARWR